jgi:hypothetical protein
MRRFLFDCKNSHTISASAKRPPQDDKKQELDVDEVKRRVKQNDEQEEEFLKSRSDVEEMKSVAEYAHAHWPAFCVQATAAQLSLGTKTIVADRPC